MDMNRKQVLAYAEQGAWEEVIELIDQASILAQAQDDFGMLPLHWACTEPSISLDVLKRLVEVFPEGCQLENLSNMMPLHVAIASKLPGLHINLLLQTYSEATLIKDGCGRYPMELAIQCNLPTYTLDLIRKAGAQAMRSSVMFDRATSLNLMHSNRSTEEELEEDVEEELKKPRSLGTLMSSRAACEYSKLLDAKRSSFSGMDMMDSAQIATQLKELMSQLQQLSVDIRSSSSHSSASTYRSSFSSISSSGTNREANIVSILWNPNDKLGIVLEPMSNDMGARIKRFGPVSSALGIEQLNVGDLLVSINGTPVTGTSYASITRFIQHCKVACTMCFTKPCLDSPSMSSSQGEESSNQSNAESEALLFAKVAELLDTTIKKVSSVEETVRMSSAMSV